MTKESAPPAEPDAILPRRARYRRHIVVAGGNRVRHAMGIASDASWTKPFLGVRRRLKRRVYLLTGCAR